MQREGRIERQIRGVQQARAAAASAKFAQRADVIDVRVRMNECRRLEPVDGKPFRDDVDVVAAVDHDRLAARFVPQDRARAAERADGEMFDDHPRWKSW